jgi:hypothetical protein
MSFSFRSGVQCALSNAYIGESSWLEVIGYAEDPPALYPDGPHGQMTGQLGVRNRGITFSAKTLCEAYEDRGISAFYHVLMGALECHARLTYRKLVIAINDVREKGVGVIEYPERKWLEDSGCLESGELTPRADVLEDYLSMTEAPISPLARSFLYKFGESIRLPKSELLEKCKPYVYLRGRAMAVRNGWIEIDGNDMLLTQKGHTARETGYHAGSTKATYIGHK